MLLKISTGDAADHFDPFTLHSECGPARSPQPCRPGPIVRSLDEADIEHTEGES